LLTPLLQAIEAILAWLLWLVHGTINATGYWGVGLLMAIESANIPLPSELILPYAGFLVQQGKMNLHLAALAGALGCVAGSLPSYALGYWGGRPFLQRFGRWLLLSEDDLAAAERWSQRFGDVAFFICRMLPVVRTFISFPAGVLKARFWPFVWLTFLGSWVWSYGLVYVGIVFGDNLAAFKHYWHQFDAVILLTLTVLGVLYLVKHLKPLYHRK
jgi:membrane protein DedA with SNARE-associated domain